MPKYEITEEEMKLIERFTSEIPEEKMATFIEIISQYPPEQRKDYLEGLTSRLSPELREQLQKAFEEAKDEEETEEIKNLVTKAEEEIKNSILADLEKWKKSPPTLLTTPEPEPFIPAPKPVTKPTTIKKTWLNEEALKYKTPTKEDLKTATITPTKEEEKLNKLYENAEKDNKNFLATKTLDNYVQEIYKKWTTNQVSGEYTTFGKILNNIPLARAFVLLTLEVFSQGTLATARQNIAERRIASLPRSSGHVTKAHLERMQKNMEHPIEKLTERTVISEQYMYLFERLHANALNAVGSKNQALENKLNGIWKKNQSNPDWVPYLACNLGEGYFKNSISQILNELSFEEKINLLKTANLNLVKDSFVKSKMEVLINSKDDTEYQASIAKLSHQELQILFGLTNSQVFEKTVKNHAVQEIKNLYENADFITKTALKYNASLEHARNIEIFSPDGVLSSPDYDVESFIKKSPEEQEDIIKQNKKAGLTTLTKDGDGVYMKASSLNNELGKTILHEGVHQLLMCSEPKRTKKLTQTIINLETSLKENYKNTVNKKYKDFQKLIASEAFEEKSSQNKITNEDVKKMLEELGIDLKDIKEDDIKTLTEIIYNGAAYRDGEGRIIRNNLIPKLEGEAEKLLIAAMSCSNLDINLRRQIYQKLYKDLPENEQKAFEQYRYIFLATRLSEVYKSEDVTALTEECVPRVVEKITELQALKINDNFENSIKVISLGIAGLYKDITKSYARGFMERRIDEDNLSVLKGNHTHQKDNHTHKNEGGEPRIGSFPNINDYQSILNFSSNKTEEQKQNKPLKNQTDQTEQLSH